MTDRLQIVPAPEAGWAAVEAVFATEAGARNCWCQFHVLSNADAALTTRESRREMLREQVTRLDPPRGLVALDGADAVGWCGVEPRRRLNHVLASRLVAKNSPYDAEDDGVWAVYCILVPPRRRRSGLGAALLRAGVDHAIRHGATAIEGYPIDTRARGGELPPGFSTGTLSMFENEGFAAVAALPSARTLVHRRVGQ
jgi:GNAT superfamily N-acetyltransferase